MARDGHVFISYKSQERQYAYLVRDQLRSLGYSTWLDVDNLSSQSTSKDTYFWQHEIDLAIKSASALVAVVTPTAAASRYVTNEWDIALVRKIPLIPLQFAHTVLPRKYQSFRLVDFLDVKRGIPFDQLQNRLKYALSSTRGPDEPYYPYLKSLYNKLSMHIGQLMIKTLTTYGPEGKESGEPIRLNLTADVPHKPVIEDLWSAISICGDQFILLGKPGSGKTTTLMNFARDAIIQRVQDVTAPLPFWGIISRWDEGRHSTCADWLAETVDGLDRDTILDVIACGNAILLCDGLDELRGKPKQIESIRPYSEIDDETRIEFLKRLPTHNQVIATCRSHDFSRIADDSPIPIGATFQDLNSSQMEEYLRDQPEVKSALESDLTLKNMLRTPLLLSIFAFIYEDLTDEERSHLQGLHDSASVRDLIFRLYVERRYKFEKQKPNAHVPFDLEMLYNILGRFALMQVTGHCEFTSSEIQKLLQDDPTSFIDEILQLHLVVKNEEGVTEFFHNLLRDHFAGGPLSRAITLANSPELELIHIATTHERDWGFAMAVGIASLDINEVVGDIVRDAAFRAAKEINLPVHDLFVLALQDANPVNRMHVVEILGGPNRYFGRQIVSKSELGVLVLALEDNVADIRRRAAQILGRSGTTQAVEPLISALHDENWQVRLAACYGLSNIGATQAAEPLISALHDENWQVGSAACHALGNIGATNEAIEPLISFLHNRQNHWVIRTRVYKALRKIGTEEALAAIERQKQWDSYSRGRNRWSENIARRFLRLLEDLLDRVLPKL